VLERQLTLDEVKTLADNTPVELEVFIHGALCCCLSGECLFSSWSGGHSGNRGKCKQPCRRRFFSRNGNGFFFSTADLCTADLIPELKKMNISSFKIEGRLRQADYVYNTVSAYRKLIDAENVDKKLMGEVRNLLSESCGRKWSNGYFSTESMQNLIQHKTLGASGVPCGQINDIQSNGFGFVATRRVHLGDRIRLQPISGDEGPSLTITKMFVERAAATVASAGQNCFVCCDKPVEFKALVYKIGHASTGPQERQLSPLRTKLNAEFHFSADKFSGKIVNTVPNIEFSLPISTAPAQKRALNAVQMADELALRSDAVYGSGVISTTFDGEYFMPLSEIKKLKLAFWEHVLNTLPQVELPEAGMLNLQKYHNLRIGIVPCVRESAGLETVAISSTSAMPGNPKARKASSIYSYTKKVNELILPDFCMPGKEASLKRLIAEAVETNFRRFRVTGLFGLQLLQEYTDLEVVTSYPLPVCNSLAADLLRQYNVKQVQAGVELERTAVEEFMGRSPLPVELYRFGRVSLLSTRAKIAVEGEIKDARGAEYMVVKDRSVGLTRLFSGKVLNIPRLPLASDYYDLTNAHWGAKDCGEFNFNTELL